VTSFNTPTDVFSIWVFRTSLIQTLIHQSLKLTAVAAAHAVLQCLDVPDGFPTSRLQRN